MTDDSLPILRFVRGLAAQQKLQDVTDGDLLVRFSTAGDETAFAVLVERHAGMVLRVCQSLLPHEAEDAFQATFLVLARQARSVRKLGSLASRREPPARRAGSGKDGRHRGRSPGHWTS
jgi:hypothetical protein